MMETRLQQVEQIVQEMAAVLLTENENSRKKIEKLKVLMARYAVTTDKIQLPVASTGTGHYIS